VADDPRRLDLRADHEAGDVLKEHERQAEGVAEVDEPRCLVGGVVVEDPAELARLVGGNADRAPAEARQARDDRLRPLRLEACTREPPSSSCVTSSPIAARTRCGPASAIDPRPRTIGTKSARPGM
jgi:hypothetical protein